MKKILYFILTFVCAITILSTKPVLAQSDSVTEGSCGVSAKWSYNQETKVLTVEGSGTVTELKSFDKKQEVNKLIIKSGIHTLGSNAFVGYKFSEVILEEGIQRIESCTFYQCDKLKEIKIPKSITYIGANAFYEVNYLRKVTILGNVTIGKNPFGYSSFVKILELAGKIDNVAKVAAGDTRIPTIVLINNNKNYCIEKGFILSADKKIFYTINGGTKIDELVIPRGVEKIMPYACYNWGLTKVKLNKNLRNIGDYAFSGNNLKVIDISSKVTVIGKGAFEDNSLTKVKFNKKIKSIGENAFQSNSLKNVRLYNYPKLGRTAFTPGIEVEHYGEKKVAGSVIKASIRHTAQKYKITINKKNTRTAKYKITIYKGKRKIVKTTTLYKNKKRKTISLKMDNIAVYKTHKVYVRVKTKGVWSKKIRVL